MMTTYPGCGLAQYGGARCGRCGTEPVASIGFGSTSKVTTIKGLEDAAIAGLVGSLCPQPLPPRGPAHKPDRAVTGCCYRARGVRCESVGRVAN